MTGSLGLCFFDGVRAVVDLGGALLKEDSTQDKLSSTSRPVWLRKVTKSNTVRNDMEKRDTLGDGQVSEPCGYVEAVARAERLQEGGDAW